MGDVNGEFSDAGEQLEDEVNLLERLLSFFISPSLCTLLSSIPTLIELILAGIIQLHRKPRFITRKSVQILMNRYDFTIRFRKSSIDYRFWRVD